jgi:hypothetical protein
MADHQRHDHGVGREKGMIRSFRAFGILFAAGTIGVLALLPSLGGPAAALRAAGQAPVESETALRLLLLVQPMLLVTVAVAAGVFASDRMGLRSLMAQWASGTSAHASAPGAVRATAFGGLAAGLAIVLGDIAFSPWTAAALEPIRVPEEGYVQALTLGLLYGGLTEEILIRWGLLSLFAWGLHRLGVPRGAALAVATVSAAILFGISHLPALAAMTELTPALVTRTIVLNAAAGCIFGALFVRHNLEAAMLAHALAHIVIFAARLAGLAY